MVEILSPDGADQRAETVYTLIGSAKLNGLDPQVYLRYVLEHIADHPITELLPWNLAPHLHSSLLAT
jgi:hypothetical protein